MDKRISFEAVVCRTRHNTQCDVDAAKGKTDDKAQSSLWIRSSGQRRSKSATASISSGVSIGWNVSFLLINPAVSRKRNVEPIHEAS
jgi:hypothetical protein